MSKCKYCTSELVTLQATVEERAKLRNVVGAPASALVVLFIVAAIQHTVQVCQSQVVDNFRQDAVVGGNFRDSGL